MNIKTLLVTFATVALMFFGLPVIGETDNGFVSSAHATYGGGQHDGHGDADGGSGDGEGDGDGDGGGNGDGSGDGENGEGDGEGAESEAPAEAPAAEAPEAEANQGSEGPDYEALPGVKTVQDDAFPALVFFRAQCGVQRLLSLGHDTDTCQTSMKDAQVGAWLGFIGRDKDGR